MRAPLVIFVYNRPALLKRMLSSLKANTIVNETEIFIFADGPREDATEADHKRIREVRQLIREIRFGKKVTIVESEKNKGLATSVVDGVSEVVTKYGRIIVSEDDVELAPVFLEYMNNALEKYSENEHVLSIGSWNYFCEAGHLKQDAFFMRYPDSIAWATYKRTWDLFEKNPSGALDKLRANDLLDRFNGDGEAPYFLDMLRAQIDGKVNSWAIRWTATSVLHNKVNLYPAKSMSRHLGFGADSTHEKSDLDYNAGLELASNVPTLYPEIEDESAIALQTWKKFVKTHFIHQHEPTSVFRSARSKLKTAVYRKLRPLVDKVKGGSSEADILIRKALKEKRYSPAEIIFQGYNLRVGDMLSVAYQLKEFFEDERLGFLCNKTEPVIIDCGSNVGVSVLYFKKHFPMSRILAFEADATIFGYLQTNLEKNHIKGVEAVNAAVWYENGKIDFGIEGADGGSVFHNGKKTEVDAIRLKEQLEKFAEIDLLKMDIEGAETEVLADCSEQLKKIRLIFVEYHSFAGRKQNLNELLDVLRLNNFRYYIHTIGNQSKQPFKGVDAYNGMDMQLDIYAINQSFNYDGNIQ